MSDTLDSTEARRAAIEARTRAETGIDEAMIERLVRGFYGRVQADDTPSHGQPASFSLTLPPLATLILRYAPEPGA